MIVVREASSPFWFLGGDDDELTDIHYLTRFLLSRAIMRTRCSCGDLVFSPNRERGRRNVTATNASIAAIDGISQLTNLRIMAHCSFYSKGTAWTGS